MKGARRNEGCSLGTAHAAHRVDRRRTLAYKRRGKKCVHLISIELNQGPMANGHGGKRAGAGRKVGSATKKTRELADAAAAQGITPLEVQLQTMRALWDAATSGPTLDFEKATAACAIAKDAAPYLHPRLSNIEAQVAVTGHEAALADLE
jgi:hypothetical protein